MVKYILKLQYSMLKKIELFHKSRVVINLEKDLLYWGFLLNYDLVQETEFIVNHIISFPITSKF